jgi:hypothetical protein
LTGGGMVVSGWLVGPGMHIKLLRKYNKSNAKNFIKKTRLIVEPARSRSPGCFYFLSQVFMHA